MFLLRDRDRNQFAFEAVLLVVANGLAGLLFMLVHVVVGRKMAALDYAVLVSLLGMLNVLNVPSSAIRVVLARYVAEYSHGNEVKAWVTLVKRACKRLGVWALVGGAGWFVLAFVLPAFFEGYTTPSLWMLGLIVFVTLFSPVVMGTLQGAHYFGWLASAGIVNAGSRLVLAVVAVYLGGRVTAVLGAVAAGSLLGLLVGYLPFHGIFAATKSEPEFESGPVYKYLWPVLAGQGALFLLLNVDLILSVRFLSGVELEAYGKAAMLSRTVMFLPLPVAIAMFPRAVNSPRMGLLWGPMAFTLTVLIVSSLAISLMPGLLMKLMYNVTDPMHNELVRIYVWATVPLSLSIVLSQYLWARHETRAILWSVPIVIIYVITLLGFHETPVQIIASLGAGGGGVFAWFLWSILRMSSRATTP